MDILLYDNLERQKYIFSSHDKIFFPEIDLRNKIIHEKNLCFIAM